MTRTRVLTWHVHGSYLANLAHCEADIFVPTKAGRPEGYGGRSPGAKWPDNLHEVQAEDVRSMEFDLVLYQSRRNWQQDRFELLSDAQRALPAIYLEHDPPREDPVNSRHACDDPRVLVVHCTAFNDLMWDSGRSPTRVIDHGVVDSGHLYTGERERGVAVVNNIQARGRRLGADIFARVRESVPVDLVGMGSEEAGGLGEIPRDELPAFVAQYRFFFNPIRYTSLGLAVLEAMTVGLPVVGLATTEMVMAVPDGVAGYLDTDPDALVGRMKALLADPEEAARLGSGARAVALGRYGLGRFCRDWEETFRIVAAGGIPGAAAGRTV